MSAQMCIVPTKDGDVEVPVGTLIWLDGEFPALADKCGFQTDRSCLRDGRPSPYGDRIAVIIAVPDGEGGWTVLDATTPEWVALTREQVAALPDRTPVRVEWEGVVSEGLLCAVRHLPESVYLHHVGDDKWWVGNLTYVTVRVRPEDVPDPDADLIERAAREIEEVISTSARWSDYQRAARRIINLARGEQA